jgi:hypothetical protein
MIWSRLINWCTFADRRMPLRTKFLAMVLLMGVFPLSTSVAQAQEHSLVHLSDKLAVCKQWRVTGRWTSGQSNAAQLTFIIHQVGTRLSGTSTVSPGEAARVGFRTGVLTGTMKGDLFVIVTHWTKSTTDGISHIGKYYGVVSKGHIEGHGVDLAAPGSAPVVWRAAGPGTCVKN